MDQRLIRIFGEHTEHYPHALESKFPRIFNTIMSLWDSDEINTYLTGLLVSDRPNRAGFPPDVAADIMRLSLVHAAYEPPEPATIVWENEPSAFASLAQHRESEWRELPEKIRSELSKLGIPATPEGYFLAAETGNRTAVALFLNADANKEIRDNRGWTPLMMAAFNGREQIVNMLIAHHADVNSLDQDGNSALHWAAFSGYPNCIKPLIDHHAGLDAQNNFGWTPLIQACARDHPEAAKMLADKGADLDAAADNGYTALHHACLSGYTETAKILLALGCQKSPMSIDGLTPLALANKNGQHEVAGLFLPESGV